MKKNREYAIFHYIKSRTINVLKSMKQKIIELTSLVVTFLSVGVGIVNFAHAASNIQPIVTNVNSLDSAVFCPIIDWMFYILMAVAVIMVMFAAYLYVVAQEDTEKTNRARRTITYAAIAIMVALLAKGFPVLVSSIFNVSDSNISLSC